MDPILTAEALEAEERQLHHPDLTAASKRVALNLYGETETLTGGQLAARISNFKTRLIAAEITEASVAIHSGRLWIFQRQPPC